MSRSRPFIAILTALSALAVAIGVSSPASAATLAGPPTLTRCNYLQAGTNHRYLNHANYTLAVLPDEVIITEYETMNGSHGPETASEDTWFRDDPTGRYQNDHDATSLALYCNGDLALRRSNGVQLWHSNTAGKGVTTATLNGGGNLVLTTATGAVVWQSASGRGQIPAGTTLLPGAKLVSAWGPVGSPWASLTMQTDGNLVWRSGSQTLWQSSTHVAGSRLVFTKTALLQVVSPAGKVLWSSTGTGSSYSIFSIGTARIFQWEPGPLIVWGCGQDIRNRWRCGKGDVWF